MLRRRQVRNLRGREHGLVLTCVRAPQCRMQPRNPAQERANCPSQVTHGFSLRKARPRPRATERASRSQLARAGPSAGSRAGAAGLAIPWSGGVCSEVCRRNSLTHKQLQHIAVRRPLRSAYWRTDRWRSPRALPCVAALRDGGLAKTAFVARLSGAADQIARLHAAVTGLPAGGPRRCDLRDGKGVAAAEGYRFAGP